MVQGIQDNLRFYQLLHWVKALNNGFEKHGTQVQPATVSNLSAYLLKHDAMPDIRPDGRDMTEFKYLKNHVNMLLSKYRVGGFLSRPHKTTQTTENHLALRRNLSTQGKRVYRYYLTESADKAMDSLATFFERKNEIGADHGVREMESVIIPRSSRTRRETRSFSVSKVDVGPFDIP